MSIDVVYQTYRYSTILQFEVMVKHIEQSPVNIV